MTIAVANDVEKLYENGLISHSDGTFECPVCHKVYKRKSNAIAHLNKQDCYSLLDIFKNTANETRGLSLYKTLVSAVNPQARTSLNVFRKSRYYNPVMRYISFSAIHELGKLSEDYLDWLIQYKNFSNVNALLSNATKESFLREFRLFLQSHGDIMIDSKTFIERYKQDLIDDQNFFIRSLEKGHLWIGYLTPDIFPIDDVYESLDLDYKFRFEKILEEIEK
jgi:hypothetical protein